MDAATIKEQFHILIDKIDNIEYLQDVYDTMALQLGEKKDVLDDLSSEQLERLDESMKQIEEGKGIPHEVIKAKHQRWLIK